jgi:hypothetical protein
MHKHYDNFKFLYDICIYIKKYTLKRYKIMKTLTDLQLLLSKNEEVNQISMKYK